ncbi:MAG: ferredoxin [Anaerolineae bacterium]
MRVSIDWDICAGAGLCARAAPRVFGLVDLGNGTRRAVLIAPGPEELLATAAFACPTLAITLTDSAGRPVYPPAHDSRAGR